MRLVDTSAFIEWLTGSSTGEAISRHLPQREEWLVPTIVQLELSKWLTREAGEEKADRVTAFTQMCVVADLDTETAISAAEFSRLHKLATADAIVYATARAHAADILTCDSHFEGLDGVTLIRKTAP